MVVLVYVMLFRKVPLGQATVPARVAALLPSHRAKVTAGWVVHTTSPSTTCVGWVGWTHVTQCTRWPYPHLLGKLCGADFGA